MKEMKYHSREIEDTKKNQREIIELKNYNDQNKIVV